MRYAWSVVFAVLVACHGNAADTDTGAVGATTTGVDTAVSPPDPDVDGDAYPASVDCDDSDPLVHPRASEDCRDGVDQDCDGRVDEDCSTDYATATLFDQSIGGKPVDPVVGDLDRDGYADVLIAAASLDTADPAAPDVLTVTWGRADFSGSVPADVVITGRNGGDGGGWIEWPTLLSEGSGQEWLLTMSANSASIWHDLPSLGPIVSGSDADAVLGDAAHAVFYRPVAGDFDGDARDDLWVCNWQGGAIYSADELAQVHPDAENSMALASVGYPAAGDLDGDGLDDLVGANQIFGMAVYLGESLSVCATGCEPDRVIARVNSIRFPTNVSSPVDIDGDGALDIVASAGGTNNAGEILALPGTATDLDQAFGDVASDKISAWEQWGFEMGATGDVDGDGHADVAVLGGLAFADNVGPGRICLVHGADLSGEQSLDVVTDCVDPAARTRGALYGPEPIFGDIDGDGAVDLVANVDARPNADYTYVFTGWGAP